jgi:hypothetical protein
LKKAFVGSYKISTTFNAPIDFVFEWCTDFREDDGKMTGSTAKRKFLEQTKERVVWMSEFKEKGKSKEGVRVVWLHPPDLWTLATCGDTNEVGEYRLTQKGKNKTRLDMKFHITHGTKDEVEDKKKWEKEVTEEWEIFARHLETDYKESQNK